jgi:hypothetical protein
VQKLFEIFVTIDIESYEAVVYVNDKNPSDDAAEIFIQERY